MHNHHNTEQSPLSIILSWLLSIGTLISWSAILNFTMTLIPALISAVIITLVTVYVKYRFEKWLKRNDNDKKVDIEADDLMPQ